jgi:hypothetical protein
VELFGFFKAQVFSENTSSPFMSGSSYYLMRPQKHLAPKPSTMWDDGVIEGKISFSLQLGYVETV